MENFVVSARKYRPATFKTLVGQSSITTTLKNAINNNQLAQAFLFCGPRGVGKTTCARILAKTINCLNVKDDIEPCNECESCKSFNESTSFNIHELDAASNNSVDDIRNLVEQVRIPPQAGKYKVYIIDEVHMLSAQAFNAFLKTLEEPPAYAKFILATTEKHKIIPTILSRCQIFDFQRIGVEDIASHLKYVAKEENVSAEEEALHIIAQKADGALRDALSMFDQVVSFSNSDVTYDLVCENLNVLDYDYYFRFVDFALQGRIPESLKLFNEILKKGFDSHYFLVGYANHLRSLLVGKDNITVELMDVGKNIKSKYIEQANNCDILFLINAMDILTKADISYKETYNKSLSVELAIMKIASFKKTEQDYSQKKNSEKPIVEEKPKKEYPIPEATKEVSTPEKPPQKTEQKAESIPAHKKVVAATGISIKDLEKDLEKKNEVAEEDIQSGPRESFNEEQLEKTWQAYLSQIKESKKNTYSILNRTKPKITTDKERIEIFVENKVSEYEITTEKNELVPFLRKNLNNNFINLDIVLDKKEIEIKAYTDQEKFEEMSEKNPSLNKLKEELHLDY